MNLSDIPGDKGSKQKRRRIGRGESSGWGKTSGRGHKGQMSRSGGGKGPGFEGGQTPLYKRVPKRGFFNPFRVEYVAVNLEQLNIFDDGAEVTVETMWDRGLARPRGSRVKILGRGELTRKLTVHAHAFSASAKQKIEDAGGSAQTPTKENASEPAKTPDAE